MSHGWLPYEVDVGLRADTLTGRAGLPLVVETLRALRRPLQETLPRD